MLGRDPDLSPHLDFHEWELRPEAWLQLGEGTPIPAYPMRLGVTDIERRRQAVERALKVSCSAVERIPGLVAFCNFVDPWGNRLGFYEDLSDGRPTLPGGYEAK